jgi:hypothetical protein
MVSDTFAFQRRGADLSKSGINAPKSRVYFSKFATKCKPMSRNRTKCEGGGGGGKMVDLQAHSIGKRAEEERWTLPACKRFIMKVFYPACLRVSTKKNQRGEAFFCRRFFYPVNAQEIGRVRSSPGALCRGRSDSGAPDSPVFCGLPQKMRPSPNS